MLMRQSSAPMSTAVITRLSAYGGSSNCRRLKKDDQGPVGSFQRRRDRDHHHDHGAGDEGAAWKPCGRFGAISADLSQLHIEFRLCRHLLEQPSSHAACRRRGNGCNALGQLASVVLAIIVSLRHRVDGGKPFHRGAHRALWRGAADGRDCVFAAPAGDHPRTRAEFNLKKSDRPRLEGQAITGAIYLSDRSYPAFLVDRPGDSCDRRADLADSRPAYRKTSRHLTGPGD